MKNRISFRQGLQYKQLVHYMAICLVCCYGPSAINAQSTFTRVENGAPVTTPSDSRSINLVDINGDGWDDIFISNGPSGGAPDYLYINRQNFVFEPETELFKSQNLSSVAATIGDIHNNGSRSIYVTNWYNQFNVLYTPGDDGVLTGTLSDIRSYSESAAWADYDADGWLDLYVSNSGNGPADNQNFLLRNDGSGGLLPQSGHTTTLERDHTRGVSWVDYDNDGDPDLFICGENETVNTLFRNDGGGNFTRILTAGNLLSYISTSMSASWGDVNNDGWLDVFVANTRYFTPQANVLWINNGDGTFSSRTAPFGTDMGCSYSAAFADYDNDGDLDLVVSNGYCQGNTVNFLYLNDGQGNFSRDMTSIPDLSTPCSFGVAWSDLDQNGFQDLVISTCRNTSASPLAHNIMWKNEGNDHHWLQLKLNGTRSNNDAIGARVSVSAVIQGERVKQIREISAQTGYCSQNSFIVHFGLHQAAMADSLEIRWPSGVIQVITQIPADQLIEIEEPLASAVTAPSFARDFSVFPNPGSGVFNLSAVFENDLPSLTLELLSSEGKIIYSMPFFGVARVWAYSFDTAPLSLAAGAYFLRLRSHDRQVVQKILVIQKS